MSDVTALSAASMVNDLRLLSVIAHNIANANTMGFKRSIAVHGAFAGMLDRQTGGSAGVTAASLAPRVSTGAIAASLAPHVGTVTDFSPGALHRTGNPLDVAIEGAGFFELRGPNGVLFSRNGAFSVDAAGRLVDSNGYAVAGDMGEIILRGGTVTIDADGVVREDGEYAGRLTRVTFSDPAALVSIGSGTWRAAPGARPSDDLESRIRQGYLEASNVDAVDAMVRMMLTVRRFEATQRVLSGYDEVLGTAIRTIADF